MFIYYSSNNNFSKFKIEKNSFKFLKHRNQKLNSPIRNTFRVRNTTTFKVPDLGQKIKFILIVIFKKNVHFAIQYIF